MKTNRNCGDGHQDQYEPGTAFTRACVAGCKKLLRQLAETKEGILAEARLRIGAPERMVRLALNEAESLAWDTGYPHLLFPALAQEKLQAVTAWSKHQRAVLRGGSVLALAE
jgi:hypothetical protein